KETKSATSSCNFRSPFQKAIASSRRSTRSKRRTPSPFEKTCRCNSRPSVSGLDARRGTESTVMGAPHATRCALRRSVTTEQKRPLLGPARGVRHAIKQARRRSAPFHVKQLSHLCQAFHVKRWAGKRTRPKLSIDHARDAPDLRASRDCFACT